MAIPASLTAIPAPRQASDGSLTEHYTVPVAPGPYVYRLGSTAPLNYPSGVPIVPPAGVSPVVTIGGTAATEVPSGTTPAIGQFSWTQTTDVNGGVITHSSADAGKAVTVVYVGDTIWTETYITLMRTALSDVAAALGAPNGLATLDANDHGAQAPAHGYRSSVVLEHNSDLNTIGATSGWTTWPETNFQNQSITINAGGQLLARLSASIGNQGAVGNNMQFRLNINSGAAYIYLGAKGFALASGFIDVWSYADTYRPGTLPATLSCTLEYQATGSGVYFQCRYPQSSFPWAGLTVELIEQG